MSKKKFKDGLESLFGSDPAGGDLQEESPLLVETTVEKVIRKERPKNKKKRSSKNFTSDLDSLFEDALKETLEDKVNKIVKDKSKISPSRRERRSALTGLDALIRRTDDGDDLSAKMKKRVTFIFDREKLARLKQIAKQQRVYLKDIIGDVVSEFIDDYEKKNGSTT